jgi:recombination protein RecT
MENKQLTTKNFFSQDAVKGKFEELLGKRAPAFITSVLQVVNGNNLLATADPKSVFNAAATAAVLDLPINNNLGFAYIVPYKTKIDGQSVSVAQFQLGYKGFIQLAQRSGQFKTINATAIYEGQIVSENPLIGYEFDFRIKPVGTPIGYAAYFKLLNGYEATLFMSTDEVKQHGNKYSKTFNNDGGIWKKDFDAMAKKTVLKLLLSRYAPLSIEMQKAISVDQGVINDTETTDITYIDNQANEPEFERLKAMIEDCTTLDELMPLDAHVKAYNDETITSIYRQKSNELDHGN